MRALYVLVPIALTVAALLFTLRGLQPREGAGAAAETEPPRYAVTGAEWVRLGRQGEPEFRARAESIDYFADESLKLHGLTVDTLGGTESPWHLQAPEGEAPPHERRLQLKGHVVATGLYEDGAPLMFTTDRLWVDLLRKELRTEDPVVLQSEFRRATARGLRADFTGERVELLSDVQVDYAPSR